jgi:hypothetical protein
MPTGMPLIGLHVSLNYKPAAYENIPYSISMAFAEKHIFFRPMLAPIHKTLYICITFLKSSSTDGFLKKVNGGAVAQ